MCKELISKTRCICGHVIDEPGVLIEFDGCGKCNVKKGQSSQMGQSTKKVPCDDCQVSQKWIKNDSNKWVKN